MMKKFFALLAFGFVAGIYSTSLASTPPADEAPVPLGNCTTLCPACERAGGTCIHIGNGCSCA
jgi:hypothetical protein